MAAPAARHKGGCRPFYRIAAALALLLAVAGTLLTRQANAQNAAEFTANTPDNAQSVLRLHVIANSDSPADQAVKLAVRDRILALMPQAESKHMARQYLTANGKALYAAVEETLAEQGCGYGAQLRLGESAFPGKRYGGDYYPAGSYDALQVVLGAGTGKNWWCVLFPPLCLIDAAVLEDTDTDDIVFESSILKWLQG